MTPGSPLVGFDAAAARFDEDERGNPVLAEMRRQSFAQLSHAFSRGSKLLEIGSGTGTESARLVAERGCRVVLADPAAQLLELAKAKVNAAGDGHLLGAHAIPAHALGELVREYGPASFDGAFSSFGALNCEPDLGPVAHALAALVKPGGGVVLSIINRWCPSEVVWFGLHGEWREAFRRWGGPVLAASYPRGPKDVRTWYYSRREITRTFASAFDVERVEAMPLFVPPYLAFLLTRNPRVFEALAPLERWASRQRGLCDLGDHVLVRLRRR